MKNIKTLLIALVAIATYACQHSQVDYTIVSGSIKNYSGEKLIIGSNDGIEIEIEVDESGHFLDTLHVDERKLALVFEKFYGNVYLFHGNKLEVTADAKDIRNTIQFSGPKSDINNYYLVKDNLQQAAYRNFQAYAKEEDEFLQFIKGKSDSLKVELAMVRDIPQALRDLELKSIKMSNIGMMRTYPRAHVYQAKKKDYQPSKKLKALMTDFNFEDEALFRYSFPYSTLLWRVCSEKGRELEKEQKLSSGLLGMIKYAETIKSDFIRDNVMYQNLRVNLLRSNDKEAVYNAYMKIGLNEKYKKEITEMYEKITKLDKGKPSPKFFNYENYAGGTISLNDFKGKYVYIDVWATWCGPCRAEIPHLEKIEKKYHDKNIVFVSISIDKQKQKKAWRKMIADKNMGGVQLLAKDKKFVDEYVVLGIPRFILIDPDGNIVDQNAPRPSDPKLIELFNEQEI